MLNSSTSKPNTKCYFSVNSLNRFHIVYFSTMINRNSYKTAPISVSKDAEITIDVKVCVHKGKLNQSECKRCSLKNSNSGTD